MGLSLILNTFFMRFHQDNLLFLFKQLYPFLVFLGGVLILYNVSNISTEFFYIILEEIFIIIISLFLILKKGLL